MTERLRIGWNLLSLRRDVLGGWQYVRGVVSAAAAHAPEAVFHALVTPESLPMIEDLPCVVTEVLHFPNGIRPLRVAVEQAMFARFVRRRDLHVAHCFAGTVPRGIQAAVALTVYDLLVFSRPQAFPIVKRAYLRFEVPRSIGRADVLVPISASTGNDIMTRFAIPSERVHPLPPVLTEEWRRSPDDAIEALRARLSLPSRYWLYVANGYVHKNHVRVLEALARIRSGGGAPWPLLLRGAGLERVFAQAADLGLADLVYPVPPLPQVDLVTLTSGASGCVFPSLFEGVGIPVLETMACGVPLVASDIPTNREFAVGYARLVPPDDAGALASAMLEVQAAPPDSQDLARAAVEVLARCHPAASAARLIRAYEAAIRHHHERSAKCQRAPT